MSLCSLRKNPCPWNLIWILNSVLSPVFPVWSKDFWHLPNLAKHVGTDVIVNNIMYISFSAQSWSPPTDMHVFHVDAPWPLRKTLFLHPCQYEKSRQISCSAIYNVQFCVLPDSPRTFASQGWHTLHWSADVQDWGHTHYILRLTIPPMSLNKVRQAKKTWQFSFLLLWPALKLPSNKSMSIFHFLSPASTKLRKGYYWITLHPCFPHTE